MGQKKRFLKSSSSLFLVKNLLSGSPYFLPAFKTGTPFLALCALVWEFFFGEETDVSQPTSNDSCLQEFQDSAPSPNLR